MLLATLDASIMLIAMPDIFRGIHLDPLVPGNSFYLLWMILGYLVVTSVLIVSLGRLGDMFGRVRIYNLGFVIYTVASLLLTVDWMTGRAGATYLIVFRIVQGVGGACLLANAAAIITDAFPTNQRGMALGINNIVGVSGMFVGLVLGGLLGADQLAPGVPDLGAGRPVRHGLGLPQARGARRAADAAPIDWWGNVTFALGLILPDGRPSPTASGPTAATAPAGTARAWWRCSSCGRGPAGRVRDHRAPRRRPDVPPAPVPDPRLHVRHARRRSSPPWPAAA